MRKGGGGADPREEEGGVPSPREEGRVWPGEGGTGMSPVPVCVGGWCPGAGEVRPGGLGVRRTTEGPGGGGGGGGWGGGSP